MARSRRRAQHVPLRGDKVVCTYDRTRLAPVRAVARTCLQYRIERTATRWPMAEILVGDRFNAPGAQDMS
eukprot:2920422-Prymnesium_polylepis.1